MKRKKRKKIHAVDAIASSECVISGKAKEIKDVRRLKSETREVKVTDDECVSGANANARRSTSANAKRKFEKEESSSDDDAMCCGWAKVTDNRSGAKMFAERVSGIAEDSGIENLIRRESGLLRKAVQKCEKYVSISLDGTAKDSSGTTKVKSATVKDSSGTRSVKSATTKDSSDAKCVKSANVKDSSSAKIVKSATTKDSSGAKSVKKC